MLTPLKTSTDDISLDREVASLFFSFSVFVSSYQLVSTLDWGIQTLPGSCCCHSSSERPRHLDCVYFWMGRFVVGKHSVVEGSYVWSLQHQLISSHVYLYITRYQIQCLIWLYRTMSTMARQGNWKRMQLKTIIQILSASAMLAFEIHNTNIAG